MASELEDLCKKARLLYDEGKYQEIIALLGDDVLGKHKDADLYRLRGNSWYGRREYDKAITDYTKAIDLKPDFAGTYNNRGNSWYDKGEYDKAIADYTKAIDLKSDFAAAYYNRGNTWNKEGEYDKAIADYTKAIELEPDDAASYYNRGTSRYYKGEYDKAIADFDKAIELKPEDAYAHYARGLAWKDKGKHAESKVDFSKYLELTPDKNDVWAKTAKSNIDESEKLLKNIKLTEIANIINDIKKLLLFNSGCITHYTGLSVAKLLLLDASPFRISEGAFLNDTSEGRELLKFLEIQFTPDKKAYDTLAEPFSRKPFIGSFVEGNKNDGDKNDDDLNLWRLYGKDNKEEAKGCAITISVDKMTEAINKSFADKADKKTTDTATATRVSDDINFYRVAYRQSDNRGQFIVPELKDDDENLNNLMSLLKEKVTDYKEHEMNDKDAKKEENTKNLEEYINTIAFLFKSDVYRSENELRLVVKGIGFEKKYEKKAPDDKTTTPPRVYIELVDLHPAIVKITIGPKVERPDEWAAAFYYSYDKEEEENKKPRILISHLPFK